MAETMLPGDVEDPGRIYPTKAIGPEGKQSMHLPTQSFASFMKPGSANPMMSSGKAPMLSPFAMMQGPAPLAAVPSYHTLLTQVNSVHSTLGDINTQLNTPNLKLKASTKYLVKGKMSDANENLRSFNALIGANVPPEPEPSKFTGPLGRFFSYFTDGQAQLDSAKMQLQSLKDQGTNMSPADFLLIQVKLNKAQQLLEFSSVLLSNAVSDLKQLMQVQL